MVYQILSHFEKLIKFPSASAHCDIPCKIYDPISAQLATLSTIRFLDLINELQQKEKLSHNERAQLVRLIAEKETHAAKVKEEICIIWGDFFKQPQFQQFPDTHELVHSIMLAASACKQHTERSNGDKLLALVNQFAGYFWQAKGLETYTATCPYPPSEQVVYPKLK
ncbi:MAG: superoxide dismutase, Ni [Kangiellaceae bacterium]|nr:superoxide dismutase, Ni [Kangiellaceae bacterium]